MESMTQILDLERIEVDLFRGKSPDENLQRVFGGQVAGQALVAAGRTVQPDRMVNSLHSYFLRPGDPAVPIVYTVDRTRDGRSFSTRRVVAVQHGLPIFVLAASFQATEDGAEHQLREMPAVPQPDAVPVWQDRLREYGSRVPAAWLRPRPVEIRYLGDPPWSGRGSREPRAMVWMRSASELPDDPLLHICTAAYASDMTLLDSVLVAMGAAWEDDHVRGASLDHAMWFHGPFRADEWLLYVQEAPATSHSRGLASGQIFRRDGTHVVSVVQEGLIRVRSPVRDGSKANNYALDPDRKPERTAMQPRADSSTYPTQQQDTLASVKPRLFGGIPPDRIRTILLPRPSPETVNRFRIMADASCAVADALDTIGGGGSVPAAVLSPLSPAQSAVGPAVTLRYIPYNGDPSAHRTNQSPLLVGDRDLYGVAQPGDIAVIDAAGNVDCAVIGSLSAAWAKLAGLTGCIVDGAIRDVGALTAQPLPIWARGATPIACRYRLEAVEVNGPVTIGGVQVRPGDLIVADANGVSVIPPESVAPVLEECERAAAAEDALAARLASAGSLEELVPGLRGSAVILEASRHF